MIIFFQFLMDSVVYFISDPGTCLYSSNQ
jgi:hypothetical protein